jgi:hypothetical protein
MNRPNLLSLAATAVLLSIASSEAMAQHAPQSGPPQYGGAPEYCQQQNQRHPSLIQLPQNHYQPPTVDHYVESAPALWDENRPIEHFLHEVASRSWVRVEFMQWDMRSPSGGTIGAPVSGLQNVLPNNSVEGISSPISINNNLNGGVDAGFALFPQSNGLSLTDAPGTRGTLGVAMNGGDLELSFFGFQQKNGDLTWNDIDTARQTLATVNAAALAALGITVDTSLGTTLNPNFAIPLKTNGIVTDVAGLNSLRFDTSLQVTMGSRLWGSEMMFLTERYNPGEGLGFQWLGGLRYTNLDEVYSIHGVGTGGATGTAFTTDISSTVVNNFYGPEAGARASYNNRWFTLSATPRVMMGLNDYTASTTADPLGTGSTSFRHRKVDFGTVTQLNMLAEVHFNTKFSIYGGYDFMWIPRLSRPNENIDFNSIPDATGVTGFTPDITQDINYTNFSAKGFSLGAVFRY